MCLISTVTDNVEFWGLFLTSNFHPRHDIAEILLKLALRTNQSINNQSTDIHTGNKYNQMIQVHAEVR